MFDFAGGIAANVPVGDWKPAKCRAVQAAPFAKAMTSSRAVSKTTLACVPLTGPSELPTTLTVNGAPTIVDMLAGRSRRVFPAANTGVAAEAARTPNRANPNHAECGSRPCRRRPCINASLHVPKARFIGHLRRARRANRTHDVRGDR